MLNQINCANIYYIVTILIFKELIINKINLSNVGLAISYILFSKWLFNAYDYSIPLKITESPKFYTSPTINKNITISKSFNKNLINILWYNTFLLPILSNRFNIEKVVQYIHELFKKYNINVICLCEVWLKRDAMCLSKYLLNILGDNWKMYDSFKNKYISDGMIIFWNTDEVDIRTIYSSKYNFSSGMDSFVSKGYITTIITPLKNMDDKKIHQYNLSQKVIFTHMQDFIGGNSIQKKNAHTKQLEQLFNTITYIKYPNYIIGDLNIEFKDIKQYQYELVPSQSITDNTLTCLTKGKYYAFDYAIKEKKNIDHSARIIYPKLDISNPSDHSPIILTIL